METQCRFESCPASNDFRLRGIAARLAYEDHNLEVTGSNPVRATIFVARYSSGQRGLTVNQALNGFGGSNPPLATIDCLVV